jgi:hypothetical protein
VVPDVLITFTGLIIAALITGTCTVMTSLYAARSARRARFAAKAPEPGQIKPGMLGWVRHRKKFLGALALVFVLIGILVFQVFSIFRASTIRGFNEQSRSQEWMAWRIKVHKILSKETETEETLQKDEEQRQRVEEALSAVLDIHKPSPNDDSPSATLRRDQAMADVLLSYESVRALLTIRFGIRKNFLGTGLSMPLGMEKYSSALVHEYLIPNRKDSHDGVWTWKLKPLGSNYRKKVKDILAGDKGERVPPTTGNVEQFERDLTDEILPRIQEKNCKKPPVIRFAKFPSIYYKGTIGRPIAKRVFTSSLAEVWDMTLEEAALQSGYSVAGAPREGELFFMWVFLPDHPDDVVPATWGEVLKRIPEWLNGKDGEGP